MTHKVSEKTIRSDIAMMRSMASHKPISPFHLAVADEMEKMLEELLPLRKYTQSTPRKWQGLTAKERSELWSKMDWSGMPEHDYGKAVEKLLKEKNNGSR